MNEDTIPFFIILVGLLCFTVAASTKSKLGMAIGVFSVIGGVVAAIVGVK